MTAALALIVGTSAGALFAVLSLPVPAPPTIAGVLGIVGLWLGYTLARQLIG